MCLARTALSLLLALPMSGGLHHSRSLVLLGAPSSGVVPLAHGLLDRQTAALCLRETVGAHKHDLSLVMSDKHNCDENDIRTRVRVLSVSEFLDHPESKDHPSDRKYALVLACPIERLVARYSSLLEQAKAEPSLFPNGIPSFREYFTRNKAELGDGVYVDSLSLLFKRVPRSSLLLFSGVTLERSPSYVLTAVSVLMGLSAPHVSALVSLTEHRHTLSCSDYKYVKCRYDFYNIGLTDLINWSKVNRPLQEEPKFEKFIDNHAHRCGNFSIKDFSSSFVGPPHVFILGVQKAGTTSLHDFLINSTNYFVAAMKEPHFFDNKFTDSFFVEQYLRPYYKLAERGRYTLDSSPGNFNNENVINRMVRLYSLENLREKKYIVILREPVSRLFSWYKHSYAICAKNMYSIQMETTPHFIGASILCNKNAIGEYRDSFRDFFERGAGVGMGYYKDALTRWLQIVPRRQMFLINFENLFGKQQKDGIKRVLEFLSVPNELDIWELPASNPDWYHFQAFTANASDLLIHCAESAKLAAWYAEKNSGLVELINGGENRPPSEPSFLPFTLSTKCV